MDLTLLLDMQVIARLQDRGYCASITSAYQALCGPKRRVASRRSGIVDVMGCVGDWTVKVA
jgi:hypothetical protein